MRVLTLAESDVGLTSLKSVDIKDLSQANKTVLNRGPNSKASCRFQGGGGRLIGNAYIHLGRLTQLSKTKVTPSCEKLLGEGGYSLISISDADVISNPCHAIFPVNEPPKLVKNLTRSFPKPLT